MTRDEIIDVKLAFSRGDRAKDIGERFGITDTAVYQIANGERANDVEVHVTARRWAHVGTPRPTLLERPCQRCGGPRTLVRPAKTTRSGVTLQCARCVSESNAKRLRAMRYRKRMRIAIFGYA